MLIKDLPKIAKLVEDFYLSSQQTTVIHIELSNPINDILELNVDKKSTYQDTLANVIARIKLHIKSLRYIELHDNSIHKTHISKSIQEQEAFIKSFRQESFRRYLSKHPGLSGHLIINHSNI